MIIINYAILCNILHKKLEKIDFIITYDVSYNLMNIIQQMSIIKHLEWTNIDDEHHMIRIIADNIDCAIEKLEKLDFEQYKQKIDIIHESNKQFTNMKKKYNIRYFYPDRLVLVDETEIFLTTTDYSVIPKNDLDKIISSFYLSFNII